MSRTAKGSDFREGQDWVSHHVAYADTRGCRLPDRGASSPMVRRAGVGVHLRKGGLCAGCSSQSSRRRRLAMRCTGRSRPRRASAALSVEGHCTPEGDTMDAKHQIEERRREATVLTLQQAWSTAGAHPPSMGHTRDDRCAHAVYCRTCVPRKNPGMRGAARPLTMPTMAQASLTAQPSPGIPRGTDPTILYTREITP
jgi:hypothetical protein